MLWSGEMSQDLQVGHFVNNAINSFKAPIRDPRIRSSCRQTFRVPGLPFKTLIANSWITDIHKSSSDQGWNVNASNLITLNPPVLKGLVGNAKTNSER